MVKIDTKPPLFYIQGYGAFLIMKTKEEQKREVEEQIESLAKDIANSTSKVGDTNDSFEYRKKCAINMLNGLCVMYKIAHS